MRKGFTLIEIMTAVLIIVVLAAIGIPNLLRSRLNANESAAISNLRTVCSAAQSYRGANINYPLTLSSLGPASSQPPYLDSELANGVRQDYDFSLSGMDNSFTATAIPRNYGFSGRRSFFVDETGVIYWTNTGQPPSTADSVLE